MGIGGDLDATAGGTGAGGGEAETNAQENTGGQGETQGSGEEVWQPRGVSLADITA